MNKKIKDVKVTTFVEEEVTNIENENIELVSLRIDDVNQDVTEFSIELIIQKEEIPNYPSSMRKTIKVFRSPHQSLLHPRNQGFFEGNNNNVPIDSRCFLLLKKRGDNKIEFIGKVDYQ